MDDDATKFMATVFAGLCFPVAMALLVTKLSSECNIFMVDRGASVDSVHAIRDCCGCEYNRFDYCGILVLAEIFVGGYYNGKDRLTDEKFDTVSVGFGDGVPGGGGDRGVCRA